jgi:hypothetical protein
MRLLYRLGNYLPGRDMVILTGERELFLSPGAGNDLQVLLYHSRNIL